jgi:hypothetical protein
MECFHWFSSPVRNMAFSQRRWAILIDSQHKQPTVHGQRCQYTKQYHFLNVSSHNSLHTWGTFLVHTFFKLNSSPFCPVCGFTRSQENRQEITSLTGQQHCIFLLCKFVVDDVWSDNTYFKKLTQWKKFAITDTPL